MLQISKVFLIFFFFTSPLYSSPVFEAYFLDSMMEHYQRTMLIGGLVTEKSQNIKIKRLFRKITRDENRDIKRMQNWRNSYFENVPAKSMFYAPTIPERLEVLEGEEFEKELLASMIAHHEKGLELLIEAQEKTSRVFLLEFSKDELRELSNEISQMKNLLFTLAK
jgi:uncharacterized protein (DUF305 family)